MFLACAAFPWSATFAWGFDLPPFVRGLFGAKDEPQPSIPAPDAVAYKTTIDVGSGDHDGLADKLRAASDLVQLEKQKPSGPSGLVRRALADRERLISALAAFGYFAATVRVDLAGTPAQATSAVDAVAGARAYGPVAARVFVEPGPLFTFGDIRFADADGRPIAAPVDRKALGLEAGGPARSAQVVAADQVIVDAYREQGFALAAVAGRSAVADHARNKLDITFKVATGQKVRFGEAVVHGAEAFDRGFVEARQPFVPGDLFSPQPLAQWRKMLTKYESFDSVRVRTGDKLDAQGRIPVEVDVKARLRHALGFGVQYSTTDGPSANFYYTYRNLFGGAEQVRFDLQVSRAPADVTKFLQDYGASTKEVDRYGFKAGATFLKPGIITVNDDLIASAAILREVTRAYDRQAGTAAIGVKHTFSDRLYGQAGIDAEIGRTTDPLALVVPPDGSPPVGVRFINYTLVGLPVDLVYDSTDRPLDPRHGIKATAGVEPYSSVLGSSVDVTLLKASVSSYYAFDDDGRYIVAGRLAGATLAGASLDSIPLPRRLYAGGGGSIRGYDFQGVGPKDAFGRPTGGLSLIEASIEGRIKVTDSIGVVPFVDAGGAFASAVPEVDRRTVKIGAGLGLRYYTAIGPIRLDVARGLNRDRFDPPYAIYISLGQSF